MNIFLKALDFFVKIVFLIKHIFDFAGCIYEKKTFLFLILSIPLALLINCKNDTNDDSSKLAFASVLQRIADGLFPTYINTPNSGATTITLTAAAESSSRIQLMWTQLPSAVSYKVYRDVTTGFTPSSTNEVVSTATSITLRTPRGALVTPINSTVTSAKNMSGLTTGTRYYYRIAGVMTNGTEILSNESNSVPATGFTVRTHAGQGVIGNTDANGYDAKFNFPQGMGIDSSGFIYLADSGNQLIRKISPRFGDLFNAGGVAYTMEGQASTLAGTGTPGNVNSSLPLTASFFDPWGSCVNSANGNIYIADSTNHSIRQITPAGVVTTLAGANTSATVNNVSIGSGILDGTSALARFNYPQAVACDNTNVYVADTYNNIIRQVAMADGSVTTLAGNVLGTGPTNQGSVDGTGAAAKFYLPRGITGDGTALFTNIYISDSGNHTIRQLVRATGVVTTIAGSAGNPGKADGTGTAATFYNPRGITYSTVSSSLYVADTNNNLIRKVTTAGVVTTVAGTGTQGSQDGVGIYTSFWYPQGVVFTTAGNGCSAGTPCLYVSDTQNHKIRRITGSGL